MKRKNDFTGDAMTVFMLIAIAAMGHYDWKLAAIMIAYYCFADAVQRLIDWKVGK